jgi:hypothetical protein
MRPAISKLMFDYLDSDRGIDGKVFDTGLSNRLRVELHELHDLERHTDLDGKAERFRLTATEATSAASLSQRHRCQFSKTATVSKMTCLVPQGETLAAAKGR